MSTPPLIYLAGPDVFRIDVHERMRDLAHACNEVGLEALIPSDGVMPPWCPEDQLPQRIYEMNMGLLRQADGVIANLMPFRGAEPDSGTVFEVGVAVALGLPVVAYGVPPGDYIERVASTPDARGAMRDASGMVVEDFGLPLNLMLACSVQIADTAENALKMMAGLLVQSQRP